MSEKMTEQDLMKFIRECDMSIEEVYGLVFSKHAEKTATHKVKWTQPLKDYPFYLGRISIKEKLLCEK